MEREYGEAEEFSGMPEQVYQDLLRRSRQISLETSLTVAEHREIVRRERAQRKESGLALTVDF
ncbi:hypothetical protein ABUK73_06400 [Agrobacterium sp. BA1120]|uniref:hypothetical protein n=1 Tax=Agrobacterium sp. BA1120 TaxID=3228927 RepID=UPI00336ACD4E